MAEFPRTGNGMEPPKLLSRASIPGTDVPARSQWPPVRFWLGRINLELGRPEDAAVYFSSYFDAGMPWTRSLYYLGLAYEEMGELQRAQAAYAGYLDIMKNADPELEPLKQQARDALVRLGPLDQ